MTGASDFAMQAQSCGAVAASAASCNSYESLTEAAEHHARDARDIGKRLAHRAHGDQRGAVGGETVDAGGDGGEGDGCEAVLRGALQRIAIAAGEQLSFAPLAAAPHGPDGVDDVAGRQIEARRDLGLAGGAAAKRRTRIGEFWTRRAMDGATHPAARRQSLVGGVDDGVDGKGGDVAFDDVDSGRHAAIAGRNPSPIKPGRGGLTGRGSVMLYHRA